MSRLAERRGEALRNSGMAVSDCDNSADAWLAAYQAPLVGFVLPIVNGDLGLHSVVGAPIIVDGAVWGLVTIASTDGPIPDHAWDRLADFTELLGTAIANMQSRAELSASRARIVAAADETRRRLERDLHDGIQQRLVSLGLKAQRIKQMTQHPAGAGAAG